MNKKFETKMITEAGVAIALSVVLGFIKFRFNPNGGSITAGSMVPLIIFSIRWGIIPGFLAGSVYGILRFYIGSGYFLTLPQFLLDYPVAFGLIALSALARKDDLRNISNARLWLGVFLGVMGRFLGATTAGVVFWADTLPESYTLFGKVFSGNAALWLGSMAYNLTYIIPELIISIVVVSIIWKPLTRALD